MEKFTNKQIKSNPYNASTFKGRIYDLVENKLSAKKGKVAGIKELCEKINNLQNDDLVREYISLLEEKKKY